MKNIKRYLECLIILLAFVLTGCNDIDYILNSAEDLNGSQIAVLDNSVSEKHLEQVFPESDIVHFKSSSEFLLLTILQN